MTEPKCPGVKSPFGPHTFRPCIGCANFEWRGEGMAPEMALVDGVRSCPNFVARVG